MPDLYYELVLPVVILVLMLVFVLIMRYFSYRERMALIKQGFIPPEFFTAPRSRTAVGLARAGLITSAASIGILLGLWVGLGQGAWLIGGFIPLGVGLGLMLSSWFSHQKEIEEDGGARPASTESQAQKQ